MVDAGLIMGLGPVCELPYLEEPGFLGCTALITPRFAAVYPSCSPW